MRSRRPPDGVARPYCPQCRLLRTFDLSRKRLPCRAQHAAAPKQNGPRDVAEPVFSSWKPDGA